MPVALNSGSLVTTRFGQKKVPGWSIDIWSLATAECPKISFFPNPVPEAHTQSESSFKGAADADDAFHMIWSLSDK